jgi:hypothetical protein
VLIVSAPPEQAHVLSGPVPGSASIRVIRATSPEWDRWLDRAAHDVFHTAAYHRFSQERGEGEAFLAVYGRPEKFLAFPYLLRRVAECEGLEDSLWYDISSVYGYPGPVASGVGSDESFLRCAWNALVDLWRQQQAVTVFSRFHPLLENHLWLSGMSPADASMLLTGELYESNNVGLVATGETVTIDLQLPESEIVRDYQKILRQEIAGGRRLGLRTEEDVAGGSLEEFAALYHLTMSRNRASAEYFFTEGYFRDFCRALHPHVHVMVTRQGTDIAAAGLFLEYQGFVHAHLAGTNERFRALSPLKVLLDDVRRWGAARGNHSFHLGGGRGGRDDSLLAFKRRFSRRRHQFVTGRWILDAGAFRSLCERRLEYLRRANQESEASDFFPLYRALLKVNTPIV